MKHSQILVIFLMRSETLTNTCNIPYEYDTNSVWIKPFMYYFQTNQLVYILETKRHHECFRKKEKNTKRGIVYLAWPRAGEVMRLVVCKPFISIRSKVANKHVLVLGWTETNKIFYNMNAKATYKKIESRRVPFW